MVMPEIAGSCVDLCKRMTLHGSPATTAFFPGSGSHQFGLFHYIAKMFMFWRGGRIVRLLATGTNEDDTFPGGFFLGSRGASSDYYYEDGWQPATLSNGIYGPTAQIGQTATHVPYYSATPYYPTHGFGTYMDNACYSNVPLDLIYSDSSVITDIASYSFGISAADDFTYLGLVPWAGQEPVPMLEKKPHVKKKTSEPEVSPSHVVNFRQPTKN